MDRLERALTRFETATDRRFSHLENVVGRLTVQVTAFVQSQKEFNATVTAALKMHDRRLDNVNETVERLARTVDRFIRAQGNGHDGH
jgi:hypothetical protein